DAVGFVSPLVDSDPFFFFQAEDGIRDFHVTGVQTCALPIWFGCAEQWQFVALAFSTLADRFFLEVAFSPVSTFPVERVPLGPDRSEERRVGKEWTAGWPRPTEQTG